MAHTKVKDEDEKMAARKVLAEETLPKWLGYLEVLFQQNDGAFFVGETLTIADLAIWRLVGWFKGGFLDGIPQSIMDDFPGLNDHYEVIGSQPKIAQWMTDNYS